MKNIITKQYLTIHDIRKWITKLPMKPTHMRWSIAERNQNLGWNICRLYLLETINEVKRIK